MATQHNTEINLAAELETIGNALWRIKELSNIVTHCLFDDQIESPTLAVLAEVITEMSDQQHSRVMQLESSLSRGTYAEDHPNWSALDHVELEEAA